MAVAQILILIQKFCTSNPHKKKLFGLHLNDFVDSSIESRKQTAAYNYPFYNKIIYSS